MRRLVTKKPFPSFRQVKAHHQQEDWIAQAGQNESTIPGGASQIDPGDLKPKWASLFVP